MDIPEVAYKRKTPETRQKELIDAGIDCLGRGGMSGFTIDQICKSAGVSRGLVNHHFKSKDDFLVRIYAVMTDHLIDERNYSNAKTSLKTIIDSNFNERDFNRSNLRAWLSIW
ncbi:MAG: TetR family transcriptional regulator, partial [Pseudomonadota bacterium]